MTLNLPAGQDSPPIKGRVIDPVVLNDGVVAVAASLPELAANLRARMAELIAAYADPVTGFVDYRGLARSLEWRGVVETTGALATARPEAVATAEVQIAFWANLYNALTVHGIVALGIRDGVGDIHEFFDRMRYRVGGETFSLVDIEHGVLRQNRVSVNHPTPVWAADDRRRAWTVRRFDPRVHFTLTCGARSCPPIRAYQADRLEAQLDLAARGFVNADVEIDAARSVVRMSRLFYWYGDDFGELVPWLLRHLDPSPGRDWLASHADGVTLDYRPYDWALNERAGVAPRA